MIFNPCQEASRRGSGHFPSQITSSSARWESQLVAWRDRLGVSDTYQPLASWKGWQLCGLEKSKRVMGILNMVVCEKMKGMRRTKANVKKVTRELLVDISQNPCRNRFTTDEGLNGTLCSSTVQVHVGRRRLVTPREMLFEQGHPKTLSIPEGVSQATVKRLAGQGMALPSLATCLWCQYLLKAYSLSPSG